MSFALRAAVLVSIQSATGSWCSLNWIVSKVIRPRHEVEEICDALVADGELQTTGGGDARLFGVGVDGGTP